MDINKLVYDRPDLGKFKVHRSSLVSQDIYDLELRRRLDSFLAFLGPGGFATPDDIEALESCQQGFRSGGVE